MVMLTDQADTIRVDATRADAAWGGRPVATIHSPIWISSDTLQLAKSCFALKVSLAKKKKEKKISINALTDIYQSLGDQRISLLIVSYDLKVSLPAEYQCANWPVIQSSSCDYDRQLDCIYMSIALPPRRAF